MTSDPAPLGYIKWYCHHYYSSRGCERGKLCTYAHDSSDIGKPYYHDFKAKEKTNKMIMCQRFSQGKSCRPECNFAHGAIELGKAKDPQW